MNEKSYIMDRRHLGSISILLGNAGVFANGLIALTQGDSSETRKAGVGRMTSAALSSGCGLIIGKYGSSSVASQLERLEKKLAAFMKQHGIPLEAELIQKADEETRKGWFSKLEDYAYDHPMESANIYNAVASLGMFTSGVLRMKRGEIKSGSANIINFLMILAGTMTCVLIPERTHAQVEKQGRAGTLWGSMQEKPLNYAVWPFLGADLSYGMQTYGEYQTASRLSHDSRLRPWAFGMSAISAFVMVAATMGDVLTGFSSKKVGGDPKDRETAQNDLINLAGRILANQPPETQKALAQHAAQYLARQQGLRMVDFDPEELAARIMKTLPASIAADKSPDVGRS